METALAVLRRQPVCGYYPDFPAASEPTALASLALTAWKAKTDAARGARWLAEIQEKEGSVGVTAENATPRWPTSLACLAWSACDNAESGSGKPAFQRSLQNATRWILSLEGQPVDDEADILRHDSTLIAWPWVDGTHSWIEPTAMHVMALKATGFSAHRRSREAVRMLLDRQLPQGGCNYGNTFVLGQQLLPHVQPTGLAMLAVAGESSDGNSQVGQRVDRSLAYLQRKLSERTPTASLCWGLLALTAHRRRPAQADHWLEHAAARVLRRDRSPHKLALLALAARPHDAVRLFSSARSAESDD